MALIKHLTIRFNFFKSCVLHFKFFWIYICYHQKHIKHLCSERANREVSREIAIKYECALNEKYKRQAAQQVSYWRMFPTTPPASFFSSWDFTVQRMYCCLWLFTLQFLWNNRIDTTYFQMSTCFISILERLLLVIYMDRGILWLVRDNKAGKYRKVYIATYAM